MVKIYQKQLFTIDDEVRMSEIVMEVAVVVDRPDHSLHIRYPSLSMTEKLWRSSDEIA